MNIRDRIIAGFSELAFTSGFHGTTMDDLSAHTGISKRTIYRYFRSKDEMVMAVMDEFTSNIEKKVMHIVTESENTVEMLYNLIYQISLVMRRISPVIIRDLQKYYPLVWQKVEQFRSGKIQYIMEKAITGNEDGYFRETIPKVFITAIQAGVRDVVNPGFVLENNISPEQAMLCLFDIFLYGIVSEEARKRQDIKNPLLPPGMRSKDQKNGPRNFSAGYITGLSEK